jgi:bacterioferritin-associated ferredoxin
MYLCICNAVKQGDVDRYHLIGTKCGKCVEKCSKNGQPQLKNIFSSTLITVNTLDSLYRRLL